MGDMMKAVVVTKPNHMAVEEVPVPGIDDEEVLIRVKYTGICGTDWSILTGKYSADRLPFIPGHEFSGVIARVGKNAKDLKEGDRVTADINMSCGYCFYCRRGQKLMCRDFVQLGIHVDGSYAEYVKAPWRQVHLLPESIDFLTGAFVEPVSCVIHSAKAMQVEMGSSVAILGSKLGMLHAAVARTRGAAPVILIGRNRGRLELAGRMGADYTIDARAVDDPVEEVKRLTGGRGADYVIEAVGTAETYELAFAMVRPGGTLAAFGITGTDEEMRLKPFEVVLGERKIAGSCAGVGNDWNDAISLLQYGRVDPRPMFSMVVPLEDLEAALKELQRNQDLNKVFVSPEIKKRELLGK
jgi:threonine dehydrogenase-like Zn-dependent dehydrogenase